MRIGLVLLGALLIAGGCRPPEPEQPPVHIEQSQAASTLHWSADLNNRLISLDGYIGFDNGQLGQAIAMGQRLYSQPYGNGEQLIRFDLEQGDGPNQLQLAEVSRETMPGLPGAAATIVFDPTRTTVQDADGVSHRLSERLRVTGRLRYVGSRPVTGTDDPDSPTGKSFKPILTEVRISEIPE